VKRLPIQEERPGNACACSQQKYAAVVWVNQEAIMPELAATNSGNSKSKHWLEKAVRGRTGVELEAEMRKGIPDWG
jgi:hypothetical protein